MDSKCKNVLSLSTVRNVLVIFAMSSIILLYVCKDQTWQQSPAQITKTMRIFPSLFLGSYSVGLAHVCFISTALIAPNELKLKAKGDHGLESSSVYNDTKRLGFLVDNLGCQIPNIPAISKVTESFLKVKIKEPKCSTGWYKLSGHSHRRGPPLVESNLTTMWIASRALKHYDLTNALDIFCCFLPFRRIQQSKNNYTTIADNISVYSKECVPFNGTTVNVELEEFEFVRVQCFKGNKNLTNNRKTDQRTEIYRDFHAFVPLKNTTENICKSKANGTSENLENLLPSILIIGIDSVSRLNLLRQLPRTYKLLTSPPFSAISLLGYNKVGDNTLPNVVPLLTGYSQPELVSLCWPKRQHKFDSCPFIWKNFSDRGYRTMYAEDYPSISTFNYKKTGFVVQPTDYYMRPFSILSWKELGHKGGSTYKLCTGSRQTFEYTLDYIKKFATRFSKKRYFSFTWSSIVSHQDVNYVHIGDNMLANTLKQLFDIGALNNTILMIMSDHGMRFGKFRETYQGRMEERLPFHLTVFPQWFKERFPAAVANFRSNANNRLISPFDIHETLLDLLNPTTSMELIPKLRKDIQNNKTKTGMSLFQKISPKRTCDDAGIVPHWCTCQRTTAISTNHSAVKAAVVKAINEINLNYLRNFSDCEILKLNYVKYAEKKVPFENDILDEKKIKLVDYIVTFVTIPGNAILEATVRHYESLSTKLHEKDFLLTGPISRLNKYGNQSYCITDSNIKLYCYCKS